MTLSHIQRWVERVYGACRVAFPRCEYPGCAFAEPGRWRAAAHGIRLHGQWYCSSPCFEAAACRRFQRASALVTGPASSATHRRLPLGLLLFERGLVSQAQLQSALREQRENCGSRIGELLHEMGIVSQRQITSALGMQWACPVLPESALSAVSVPALLPAVLLQRFGMLPVYFSNRRVLCVAFGTVPDYTALYAVEQALACRTEACIVDSAAMNAALSRHLRHPQPFDHLFEGPHTAGEMARITCSCAIQQGASEVRLASCGEYLWARLETPIRPANLLFEHRNAPTSGPCHAIR